MLSIFNIFDYIMCHVLNEQDKKEYIKIKFISLQSRQNICSLKTKYNEFSNLIFFLGTVLSHYFFKNFDFMCKLFRTLLIFHTLIHLIEESDWFIFQVTLI